MSIKKCTMLCVDDHEDSGEMLVKLFHLNGFEAQTGQARAAALRMMREEICELVILDSLIEQTMDRSDKGINLHRLS